MPVVLQAAVFRRRGQPFTYDLLEPSVESYLQYDRPDDALPRGCCPGRVPHRCALRNPSVANQEAHNATNCSCSAAALGGSLPRLLRERQRAIRTASFRTGNGARFYTGFHWNLATLPRASWCP
jgi:hypothetical protein